VSGTHVAAPLVLEFGNLCVFFPCECCEGVVDEEDGGVLLTVEVVWVRVPGLWKEMSINLA
jgi:hypothetical protein